LKRTVEMGWSCGSRPTRTASESVARGAVGSSLLKAVVHASGMTTLECDVHFALIAGETPDCARQFSSGGPLIEPGRWPQRAAWLPVYSVDGTQAPTEGCGW
jgi:hypothetical protein